MTVFDLWLPIVLTGVVTHVLSTIAWTVLPHHKPEWRGLEDEAAFQEWLVHHNVGPGQYLFPYPHEMKGPAAEEFRGRQGKCRGLLAVYEKPVNMGAAILKTLAFFFVTAFVIGYLASLGVPRGAAFLDVFQFVTTAGLLAHCFGKFPHVFWFPERVAMSLLDGLAYAAATGLVFAWLWPGA